MRYNEPPSSFALLLLKTLSPYMYTVELYELMAGPESATFDVIVIVPLIVTLLDLEIVMQGP